MLVLWPPNIVCGVVGVEAVVAYVTPSTLARVIPRVIMSSTAIAVTTQTTKIICMQIDVNSGGHNTHLISQFIFFLLFRKKTFFIKKNNRFSLNTDPDTNK